MNFFNSFLFLGAALLLMLLLVWYNKSLGNRLEGFLKRVGAIPNYIKPGKILEAFNRTFVLNWYIFLFLFLLWLVLFKIGVGKDMITDYYGNLLDSHNYLFITASLMSLAFLIFLLSLIIWAIPFFIINEMHSQEMLDNAESYYLGTKIKALLALTVYGIVGGAFLYGLLDLFHLVETQTSKFWIPLVASFIFLILFFAIQSIITQVSKSFSKKEKHRKQGSYLQIIFWIVALTFALCLITAFPIRKSSNPEFVMTILCLFLLANSIIVFRWLYYTNDTDLDLVKVKKIVEGMLSPDNRTHSKWLFIFLTAVVASGVLYYYYLPSLAGTNTLYVLLVLFSFMILYLEWLRRIRRNHSKLWVRCLALTGIIAFLVMPLFSDKRQYCITLVDTQVSPTNQTTLDSALTLRIRNIKSANVDSSIYIICGMGGGSRAGYFTATYLQLLDSVDSSFFDRVLCYSTISGSSPGVYHYLKGREKHVRDNFFLGQIYQRNYNSSGVFGFLFADGAEALLSPILTSIDRVVSDSVSPNWYSDRNVRIRDEYEIATQQALYFADSVERGGKPDSAYHLDYGYRSYKKVPDFGYKPDQFKDFFQSRNGSVPIHFINTFEVNSGRRTVLSPFDVPSNDIGFFENAILPLQDTKFSKDISKKDIMYRDASNLSELFPFISAASTIGDNSHAQFVDGGYFENYGLSTAWSVIQYVAHLDSSAFRRIKVILIRNSEQEPREDKRSIQVLAPISGVLSSPFTGHANHQLHFFENNLHTRFMVESFNADSFHVPLTRALTRGHIESMNKYIWSTVNKDSIRSFFKQQ